MTAAIVNLLEEARQLSICDRAEFVDRLLEDLADATPPEVQAAQIAAVRQRIAEVEAGNTTLIDGKEALASVRSLMAIEGGTA